MPLRSTAAALRRHRHALALSLGVLLVGCGHSERTRPMRSALDAGNMGGAVAALDKELGVDAGKLPPKLEGDNALLVLDRASLQQARAKFTESKRDFEAADKVIDTLDLSTNASDTIATYLLSGSAGRYAAPPYERLMINTLNMVNYLETRDLSGALVEARRLAVMQKFYRDHRKEGDSPILALGGFLAGLAYEKSGDLDEALHYYDDALAVTDIPALDAPLAQLLPKAHYRTARLEQHAARAAAESPEEADYPEIIVVAGYGRVPHKIAHRVPIGLALTYFSGVIRPDDRAAANRLAAQGLVTWINYPTLAETRPVGGSPSIRIDGRPVVSDEAVDVEAEMRREWHAVEGSIVASAITRLIARSAVGMAVGATDTKGSGWGTLLSLAVQGAGAAADTPDTRSWETLPARVSIARYRVPPGRHRIDLSARGISRSQTVELPPRSWLFVSLQALR